MAKRKSIYGQVQHLTLPSGKRMRVKRPSLLHLVAAGALPSEVTAEVWKATAAQSEEPAKADTFTNPQALQEWSEVIGRFIPTVLVDPKIGNVTDLEEDDETRVLSGVVALEDISDLDRQFIFLYGTGVYRSDEELEELKREEVRASQLAKFRGESARGDAGRGGEEVRDEAVTAGGVAPPEAGA